ncbi:MAG TPA: 2'-5' RNA ligase family protein [Bacteroidetes bacterium]|nr:2'-5' RNA ligase family protein [Bacteroidota bacterium]
MQKNLYFIALIPPEDIMSEVLSMQKEIANKYGSYVALKAPGHITVQKPFFRNVDEEPLLSSELNEFCKGQTGFEISLNNYGSFPPRTIYIKPKRSLELEQLYENLRSFLESKLNFNNKELGNYKFNPHMTIANRDISKTDFAVAWKHYQDKEYKRKFMLNNISLLKHNGENWDIHKSFDV